MKIWKQKTESIILPKIFQFEDKLYGASFELMKLLPAMKILDEAEKNGELRPNGHIVESTSGTFGLGLALLAAERGYKCTLVSDPVIDEPLRLRLSDLGAEVIIVDKPHPVGGFQTARLAVVHQILEKNKSAFWPRQYENENNPKAYEPFADFITKSIGGIDVLIGAVGSGGSTGGTANYLRKHNPGLELVGVDSICSMIFGRPNGKRLLRGLGSSILPANVKHELYDEVHWITDAEAFKATRILHRKHQLYLGPCAGAVYLAGKWISETTSKKVLMIFPDEGYRYESSVYSDEWLRKNDVYTESIPDKPDHVDHPQDAGNRWAYMKWNRREYKEVAG